jgi:MarR family transcriptional regulator, organic hydroperoxide resistance regulator
VRSSHSIAHNYIVQNECGTLADVPDSPTRADNLALDRQLCFALYTASRAMTRAYGPLLDGTGLTYPQYLVMLVLWETPEEAQTVGELGVRLHLDSGTLTPLLKRLEAVGYVERRRSLTDERQVHVRLTGAGLALRARAEAVPASLAGCVGLAEADIDDLRERLNELTATLETRPAPRATSERSGPTLVP